MIYSILIITSFIAGYVTAYMIHAPKIRSMEAVPYVPLEDFEEIAKVKKKRVIADENAVRKDIEREKREG